MLSSHKITEIFFIIDEFDKNFEKIVSDHSLVRNTDLKQRNRKSTLSDSEVMTILILFPDFDYAPPLEKNLISLSLF